MLAYDYPVLGVFWSMLMFFIWIAWIILVFRIFVDVFRSPDIGGFGKAFWCIFVIVLPILGVLVYLIVHGGGMAQRDVDQARQNEAAFRSYIRDTAGTGGTADELTKLADLHARGALSDDEFAAQKAKLLG